MMYSNRKLAGLLFFLAAAQFILGVIIAEALYPGYNISTNYISDLGIGPSATIFNISIFLVGLLSLIATYFLHRAFHNTAVTLLLTIAAVAAMNVGIFTENSELMHSIASVIVFFFGSVSAIISYRLTKQPFSILAVILGIMSLCATIFFIVNLYMGLGAGGMERMIVYPILIWMIGFGGYLNACSENP